jgi:Protein of unknown function (DUF1470).
VHDAAQRAADLLAVLLPGPGRPAGRAALIAVLRQYGESGPIEVSATDLAELREAALLLREVFAAEDADTAANRLNGLLAGRAHPPRLTSHGGTSGWHLHVDGDDDAPWAEWFLPPRPWRWPCCWPSARRRRPGCAPPRPAASRS